MKIIGIAGQMQVGKDTVADRLKVALQGSWERFAFAAPLKKIYCDSFNVDLDFIEKWKVKDECPPDMNRTVRQGLQFIGDGFREIMPSIWIMKALKHMEKNQGDYIVSDVRYLNEAKAIRAAGGLVLLVWRKDKENDNPNKSEQEVKPTAMWCRDSNEEGLIKDFAEYAPAPEEKDLFDIFIRNDGSVDDLYNKVDTWLAKSVEKHYGI